MTTNQPVSSVHQPSSPLLYELNTRCWLNDLSRQQARNITLANVPKEEFTRWQRLGFTHIWLMGVWTTGPRGRAHDLNDPSLVETYTKILPDWQERDVLGSPYAITDYQVPAFLGGETGLASFRQQLHALGLKLILDFVPNHVGLDHPWVNERPEFFVHSPQPTPESFPSESPEEILWLGHGKDPFFPAWIDTAQLDYRRPDTQRAMADQLQSIANRCDGVRCDMAMLVLKNVFAKTWQGYPCPVPVAPGEFWTSAIAAVTAVHPDFLFLAEAYWDLETKLHTLGFNYTYDKRLLDLLLHHRREVQEHLLNSGHSFVAHSAHFLENHDEARIAFRLNLSEHRAAALLTLALPGMRFLHEGQLTGARVLTPVQLGRRPAETADPEITALYEQLLLTLQKTSIGQGRGTVLETAAAWPENPTASNLIVIYWPSSGHTFNLIVVNLAPHPSQCRVILPVPNSESASWRFTGLLGTETHLRPAAELRSPGLFLDLPANGAQIFTCELGS